MAEMSLPKEVNFASALPVLPDGAVATLMSVQSTNGISFTNGQVIQFDLPSQNGLYIIPSSVFLRYKYEIVGGTATAPVIVRKPAYTLLTRLEEFIGSTNVSSIYQYNLVANGYVDINYSVSDVMGQYLSWGLGGTPSTFYDVDGQTGSANATFTGFVAAPLVCSALSGLSHYYPTGLTAPWRVQLTVAPVSEITTVTANITSANIIQPELCFQVIQLGSGVDNLVASMSPQLKIKTTAYAAAAQSIASSSSGYVTLPFNHRYESINNLYLYSTSTDKAKGLNGWGDSFNPMNAVGSAGSVQFQVGQQMFPQLPINNATGGATAILQYLRQTVGALTDNRNTMAILADNFTYTATGATATTAQLPAKCIIAVPCSKLLPASPYSLTSLMSGVSATQSPINVLLNIGASTNTQMTFYLVAEYDQVLVIDPMTKQVQVIC